MATDRWAADGARGRRCRSATGKGMELSRARMGEGKRPRAPAPPTVLGRVAAATSCGAEAPLVMAVSAMTGW